MLCTNISKDEPCLRKLYSIRAFCKMSVMLDRYKINLNCSTNFNVGSQHQM